jgi:uncharacterized protein (TIGR02452 family)
MFDQRQATNPAARQVLEILDAGGYETPLGAWVSVRDEQGFAESGTRLYSPEELERLRRGMGTREARPLIEVVDETTQMSAQRLAQQGPIVLLNFASARNPGGGFLGGAKAQEEELCRCSGLYRTLITQPTYYLENREQHSLLYTDYLIYSPRVPFFRISATSPLLDHPYLASVITTPAPNAGALLQRDPTAGADVRPTFERRWANVLAAAEDNGHRLVLLGAWGCGAFRNDPVIVAEAARSVLLSSRFVGAFDQVVFPIPNIGERGKANFAAFRELFNPGA